MKKQLEQTDNLCDYCGYIRCALRKIQEKVKINKLGAVVGVRSCETFIPILDFQSAAGCDGEFNTCRMGVAWADRLTVGQGVALHEKGERVGAATVTNIVTGVFSEIRMMHQGNNHLAIDAAGRDEPFDLRKVMIDAYGKNWFEDSRPCTFIYLKRVN